MVNVKTRLKGTDGINDYEIEIASIGNEWRIFRNGIEMTNVESFHMEATSNKPTEVELLVFKFDEDDSPLYINEVLQTMYISFYLTEMVCLTNNRFLMDLEY